MANLFSFANRTISDNISVVDCSPDMRTITIYTDGSCKKPNDVGGWAFVIFNQNKEKIAEDSCKLKKCTNNTAEMIAIISGITKAMALDNMKKVKLYVYSDSQYCIKGATSWITGWKQRNWKTKTGDPVKNKELWLQIDALLKEVTVEFVWTKGHADDTNNCLVDDMAGKTWREEEIKPAAPTS